MGIDLETWRARIGLFHASSVGRHLKRQQRTPRRNVAVCWNTGETMNYMPHLFVSCFTVVLLVQYVLCLYKKYKGAHVQTALVFIFSGMKLCCGVASTIVHPRKSILVALSLLLIIAGDVELNPGPVVGMLCMECINL